MEEKNLAKQILITLKFCTLFPLPRIKKLVISEASLRMTVLFPEAKATIELNQSTLWHGI